MPLTENEIQCIKDIIAQHVRVKKLEQLKMEQQLRLEKEVRNSVDHLPHWSVAVVCFIEVVLLFVIFLIPFFSLIKVNKLTLPNG
tara:strand:+ start:554 stop:808 length:255 start_codon:yes stop_codon:yes gene_type:complete